jgi:hypothetical protein
VLRAGNVVCTTKGVFRFLVSLNAQGANCVLKKHSALRVLPQPGVTLRFIAGTTACGTSGTPPQPKTFMARMQTEIIVEDPVFEVEVRQRKTIVTVLSGSALVSGKSGTSKAVVLGPAQQTIVAVGGDPAQPTGIHLTSTQQADQNNVGRNQTPPDFSRPNPDASPNLNRIFQQQSLHVGFDEQAATDSGTTQFVRSYLDFLATSWKLSLDLQTIPSGSALTALANNKLDLVVAPTVAFGFDSLPLFADSNNKRWIGFLNTDPTYASALRTFVVSTINDGEYGSLYKSAFGRAPSYDAVRQILFAH